MVNTVVLGYSHQSNWDKHLSFYGLPLSNKPLLTQRIHVIGYANQQVSRKEARIRWSSLQESAMFANQSENTCCRRSIVRHKVDADDSSMSELESVVFEGKNDSHTREVGVNTKGDELTAELEKIVELKSHKFFHLAGCRIWCQSIFLYRFPYAHWKPVLNLGSSCFSTEYRDSERVFQSSNKGRPWGLPPLAEFFLTMMRLRLGLPKQDMAYCFGISQSTVSRTFTMWINFLFLQFKEIPLWPPQEYIRAHMPQVFREWYPTTWAIVEVFIQKPSLSELQKLTFSTYKNHNTYKGIICISPYGAVIFVSNMFPGSSSDKEHTWQSCLLGLLQPGDSVMVDRGFDIMEDLPPIIRVRLNIPPFICGKSQTNLLRPEKLLHLNIHVEQRMQHICGVLPLSLKELCHYQMLLFENRKKGLVNRVTSVCINGMSITSHIYKDYSLLLLYRMISSCRFCWHQYSRVAEKTKQQDRAPGHAIQFQWNLSKLTTHGPPKDGLNRKVIAIGRTFH